jgi:hypothetical protein
MARLDPAVGNHGVRKSIYDAIMFTKSISSSQGLVVYKKVHVIKVNNS